MIPFLDLSAATAELRPELDEAYHRFMDSGWYVLGKEVESFELEYAAYCNARYCVGLSTGLDALVLALRALDIGPGDEVIVPSNTYIATWLAVSQVGATIVAVEPDVRTYNLDPNLVDAAMTSRTRVILGVNLFGQPVDYDALGAIAQNSNCKLIIDNAQAQGALYKDQRVGGLGYIECHSFYPSKNLGAFGEAGAITTNEESIAERIKLLRNYGSKIRYHNEEIGTNSRLDAIQAAFLRVKLRHLDSWNSRRRSIVEVYQKELANIPNVTAPYVPEWADPVWHLYVIRTHCRDQLRDYLEQHGVATQIHYPIPPHLSDAYRNNISLSSRSMPIAEMNSKSILSLPMGPHLTKQQTQEVCVKIATFTAF